MNKKAFTLAETMIVLVILGIVAAITIPALVRRQVESSNRTRIKKAMTVYDTALNKMVVENGIKSNDALINEFNADRNNNSCAKSRAYFKVSQDGANDCTFRASDGIWWNISDITNPIIAFNEDDLTDEIASGDTNKAFKLVGYLDDNGSLRVGDLAVAEGDNQEYLTKLYNFVNNAKLISNNEEVCENTESCFEIDDSYECEVRDCHGNAKSVGYHCSKASISSCSNYDVNGSEYPNALGMNCSEPFNQKSCEEFLVSFNESLTGLSCKDPSDVSSCRTYDVIVYEGEEQTVGTHVCKSPTDLTTCEDCYYFNTHEEIDCSSLSNNYVK